MVLLLPLYMLFIGLFAVGVGWFVSSLQVYLRDTAQILAVVMTLWFWFTPIMISERPHPRALQQPDPLESHVLVVRAYRDRLLSAQWPSWQELAVLAAYSCTVFIARRPVLPPPKTRLRRRPLEKNRGRRIFLPAVSLPTIRTRPKRDSVPIF